MEIRQLRYFVRIADMGSLSRASQVLHIAQPALSQQMAQLEAELGQPLLHRRHNGVQVTEQGAAFYRHAQKILRDLDDLGNVVNQSAQAPSGTVTVGLPQSTAAHYALPLLSEIQRRHPGIGVEFFDEISGNLLRGIQSGRMEIAVLVSDQDAALTDAVALMEEELFLIAAPGKFDDGAPIPLAQLATIALTLPGMEHGVRAMVEQAVRAAGAQLPRPSIVANSINIMRQAVKAGAACSVMPWAAVCDDVDAGKLRAIPLQPALSRTVHVCCARDLQLSLAGRAVKELLIEQTRDRVRQGLWRGARLL
jgi:LysR family nitrogen assimilation transcriptional regulator